MTERQKQLGGGELMQQVGRKAPHKCFCFIGGRGRGKGNREKHNPVNLMLEDMVSWRAISIWSGLSTKSPKLSFSRDCDADNSCFCSKEIKIQKHWATLALILLYPPALCKGAERTGPLGKVL